MQSLLKIKDYNISLYIGVEPIEQNNKQEIYIDIEVKFKSLPKSIETDDIHDDSQNGMAAVMERNKARADKKAAPERRTRAKKK